MNIDDLGFKYGEDKVFWVIVGVFVLLTSMIAIIGHSSFTRFEVDSNTFKYNGRSEGAFLFVDNHREEYQYIRTGTGSSGVPTTLNHEDFVLERHGNFELFKAQYYLNENLVYESDVARVVFEYENSTSNIYEVELMLRMDEVYSFLNSGFTGQFVALAILMILLGAANVVYRENMWKIRHVLWVKGGEPTEGYLGLTRAMGWITIILSQIILLVGYSSIS